MVLYMLRTNVKYERFLKAIWQLRASPWATPLNGGLGRSSKRGSQPRLKGQPEEVRSGPSRGGLLPQPGLAPPFQFWGGVITATRGGEGGY